MSKGDKVDGLIEAIAEAHWRSQVGPQPRWPDDHTMPDIARSRARAALDALKADGWEVVKLPEASYTHTDSDLSCERGLEWDTASGPLRAFEDGHVEWDGDRSSVDEFRRTAAAFLAAARAAEAVSDA